MSKLPPISGRAAIKAFMKIGYRVVRQKGSHVRLFHSNVYKRPLTVPDHKNLGRGLLRKLLRDAEISIDDFIKLLKN